jgi:hypothetical protein
MPDNDNDLLIVHGRRFWKQPRWARDKKISVRSVITLRQQGCLPWLLWAGTVYIGPEDEADAYIAARVRRRNPARRRRQAAASAEISAS